VPGMDFFFLDARFNRYRGWKRSAFLRGHSLAGKCMFPRCAPSSDRRQKYCVWMAKSGIVQQGMKLERGLPFCQRTNFYDRAQKVYTK
jgi:hypothetical protein